MMQAIRSVVAGLALMALGAGSALAVPTYDVQGGFLVGIKNVSVGGVDYDVVFRDGVLEDLFDLGQPFVFDAVGANAASQALALTLLDVPEGDFDTNPLLTTGITADNGHIYTPYDFAAGFVSVTWFRNAAFEGDDERGSTDLLPAFDSRRQAAVFADWSRSQPVIPEPATVGLIALGLAGLATRRRR